MNDDDGSIWLSGVIGWCRLAGRTLARSGRSHHSIVSCDAGWSTLPPGLFGSLGTRELNRFNRGYLAGVKPCDLTFE